MSTSGNVIEYRIIKDGEEVGYLRKNMLCKYPEYSDLLKYEPLKSYEIQAYGYDEEEEYWEGKIKNLETFLRSCISIEKKIHEYFLNKDINDS